MPTQSAYNERMPAAFAGMLAGHANSGRRTTGICETASPGIPFGRAVSQGALSNEGVILAGSLAGFRGVSIADPTLRGDGAVVDAYLPPDNVAVMETGDIWVAPGEAVAAHDPVFFNTTTGVFMKATGTGITATAIPGAYFKTACGVGGLAILALPQGGRAA